MKDNDSEKAQVDVIIPVKDGEHYIKDCINSVLQQTIKNINIILIDDGSKDKTGEICDYYALSYKNIKAFHLEGVGVAAARNFGVENSNGEYFAFLDADDLVVPNCYEILLNKAIECDCALAICNYNYFTNRNIRMKCAEIKGCKIILSDKNSREELLKEGYVWNKLYKRAVFGKLKFPNYNFGEDYIYTWNVAFIAEKYCIVSADLYYYFQSYKIYKPSTDCIKVYNILIKNAEAKDMNNLILKLKKDRFYHALIIAHDFVLYKEKNNLSLTRSEVRILVKNTYEKNLKVPFNQRLRFFLLKYNWVLFVLCEKFLYLLKHRK